MKTVFRATALLILTALLVGCQAAQMPVRPLFHLPPAPSRQQRRRSHLCPLPRRFQFRPPLRPSRLNRR